LLQVFLTIEPAFGSERITAKASTVGDSRVVEGENLTWSSPNERLNFTLNADDYDPATNHTKIRISEFRYYFTMFKLNVGLLFDFHSWIDWLTGDPTIKVATLDLSWIIEKIGAPYLGGHPGYLNSVYITLYVERIIPPPETTEPRDITVLYATIGPIAVYPGRIINITVAAANLGNVTETFNVAVRYDDITIGTQSVTGLRPNENITLTFSWNTTGLPECYRCNVFAEATPVPNEIDIDDNTLATSLVKIKMFGDINNDDKVDMKDIGLAASAFGSHLGDTRWDSEIDGNEDDRIDLRDIGVACVNFGRHYP
jgi:hypothetical protein